MGRSPLIAPVRQTLIALAGTAVGGLVLAGYGVWTAIRLPSTVEAFLGALTPADRLLFYWMDPADIAHGPEGYLPAFIAVGLAALALGGVGIAVRYGYPWSRKIIWIAGILVALVAFILALSEGDLDLDGPRRQALSPGARAAYDLLLPPGFTTVPYLAELLIVVSLGAACVLLSHHDVREFLYRRRQLPEDDPRVWRVPSSD